MDRPACEVPERQGLAAPWHADTVLQLRTGRMKAMRGLAIETGICKEEREGRLWCGKMGLEGDEHDLTFHGGVDKAVHQYYPGHYPLWRSEYPTAGSLDAFVPGGFGENIVAAHMNERNVCIGDIIRVGEALLQVSLPRQPCFKLNHRFGIKSFASQTWKKSRTGWYYRVLKEGWIAIGDSIMLVERRWERWTVERVHEYLHRNTKDLEKLEELEQIPEFGSECKKAIRKLVAALKAVEASKIAPKETFEHFTLVSKKAETPRISSFTFAKSGTEPEGEGSAISPGSFVRLRLPNGLLRSYSVVSGTSSRFTLGVALDDQSRGGSRFMHETLKEGEEVLVGKVAKSVPRPDGASNHVFIGGGIGITAFLGLIDVYRRINYSYTLHYAVRCEEDIPFKMEIEGMGGNVVVYDGSKGARMDIKGILKARTWNSMVYVCGPRRMIEDVQRCARELGMGEGGGDEEAEIHYEAFQADNTGDPFSVEVGGQESRVLDVPGEKTLLQVLREEGMEIDSSCEVGNCGACKVLVRDGVVQHRGSALSAEEKRGGAMLSCCSRGVGMLRIEW
ncbi:hypothetical protein LZ554_000737 [Drepanopeziza brunnea f. sp. 'monogermtubi']|nr:hypothetical protein LZ554_000737 [Drepanopeziza brunnea f. sp. 'monogermtubi']